MVIVVTSGKGGTGKSSFSAGVAGHLAGFGKKVLCIDTDMGLRKLDLLFGLSDVTAMNFYDVICGNCTLDQAAVQHSKIPGLFLLTAPMTVTPEEVSQESMKELLAEVRKNFDYCIIDCPAGIGSGFKLACCGADRAIVVAIPDVTSYRDSARTALELQKLNIEDIHLAVNRVRPRLIKRLDTTVDDAMDVSGLPLIGVIPEDDKVPIAAKQGIPIAKFSKRGASCAYQNIAKRLIGQTAPLMKIKR